MIPGKSIELADVLEFYIQMENLGVKIWIDGGWGVDALIEKQTRIHSDLDIAMEDRNLKKAVNWLVERGYKEVRRDNEWNFVLSDEEGREIDFHVFIFDENQHVIEGIKYPDGSLEGIGRLGDHEVHCIPPDHIVRFHSGYKLRDSDFKDVKALCDKFGIDYPEEYVHLKN